MRRVLLAAVAFAAVATGVSAVSICDKYSSTTNGTQQLGLITSVVNLAVLGNKGTVPGIFNTESQKPYFNATVKFREASGRGVTPNFIVNAGAGNSDFATLANHLYGFFGVALNCSQRSSFPYTGNTMTYAHSGMNLTLSVFSAFNGIVAAAARDLGVEQADLDTIGNLLNSYNRQAFSTHANYLAGSAAPGASGDNRICTDNTTCPCATIAGDATSYVGSECLAVLPVASTGTICDRYTAAQTSKTPLFPQGLSAASPTDQRALVTAIVNRAVLGGPGVTGIVNVASNAPYFNGSLINRNTGSGDGTKINFLANPGQNEDFNKLALHLYQFFSMKGALSCSLYNNNGNEAYTGNQMNYAHAKMAITKNIFSDFNQQIIDTAIAFGVSDADQTSIRSVLNSFSRQQNADGSQLTNSICNQNDCACALGYGMVSGSTVCVAGTFVTTSTGSTFIPTPTTASSTGTNGAVSAASFSLAAVLVAAAAMLLKQ